MRHPALTDLLGRVTPTLVIDQTWGAGQPIRCAAYTEPAELPDEVLTSIRCIVRVGERVVICSNRDGFSHPWPGGRREPGETYAETACREVMEETGWTVDPQSLEPLGWLDMEKLDPPSEPDPFPHPDFEEHEHHIIEDLAWFPIDRPDLWGPEIDEDAINLGVPAHAARGAARLELVAVFDE